MIQRGRKQTNKNGKERQQVVMCKICVWQPTRKDIKNHTRHSLETWKLKSLNKHETTTSYQWMKYYYYMTYPCSLADRQSNLLTRSLCLSVSCTASLTDKSVHLPLSLSAPLTLQSSLNDCFGHPWWAGDMPKPLQTKFLYCGKKLLIGPYSSHFLICSSLCMNAGGSDQR